MRRTLARLPTSLRRFLLWQSRRVYGTWLFSWMNGEVGQFIFRVPGNPVFSSVWPTLAIYSALVMGCVVLGEFHAGLAFLMLVSSLFVISPLFSAAITMMTLSRWRRSEVMEELAVLPFGRDAIRTMLLLPMAMVIRLANLAMAWMLFVMVPVWCAPGFVNAANATGLAQLTPYDGGKIMGFLLIFTGPLAFFAYCISMSGIAAGWYLATRFHGPNAFALALLWGLRMVAGLAGSLVGGMYLIYNYYGEIDQLVLFPALVIIIFCWYQVWKAGVQVPRRWARYDTILLQRNGVEVLQSPEVFRRAAGRPSLGKVLGFIVWPWPRFDYDQYFVQDDDDE